MPTSIRPPVKPFPSYKWRWAGFQPTENLNDPAVYLGVLRVLKACEGMAPSSIRVIDMLKIVETDIRSSGVKRLHLARTGERNLIRNSKQYWTALDLLDDTRGRITLTDFGRKVADGVITKSEFATTVIKTLTLPNRHIETDTSDWDRAGLTIKPLELILDVLMRIRDAHGPEAGFLTPDELIRIVIPLAGAKEPPETIVRALHFYRRGALDISGWPDCASGANDPRMAKEFLLFLWHYGFLRKEKESGRVKFYLSDISREEIQPFLGLRVRPVENTGDVIRKIRETNLPTVAERRKVQREVTARPDQPKFRNNVLAAYDSKCLFTGVQLETVLEAAHIKPVPYEGNDRVENGLCLRSDIHVLFDSGHLRIEPSGVVHLSEVANRVENYRPLPRRIILPRIVNRAFLDWRWKYY